MIENRNLYAIVGHPTDTLRSPRLFLQSLKQRGLPGAMTPFDVTPDLKQVPPILIQDTQSR